MKRKTLSLMDVGGEDVLSRDEMKHIMAGSAGGGRCYVKCQPCNNSTCRGWVDDCSPSSVRPICPFGPATCTC